MRRRQKGYYTRRRDRIKKGRADRSMNPRVTLADIAREVGLSTSTVSRVLNGSILISDENSALIHRAAERLGYRKRPIRRHMSRAILNVLLFLPRRNETYSHLFYDVSDLIAGIRNGFGETRVNIITRLQDDQILLEHKKSGDIGGCIFAFCEPSEGILGQLEAAGIEIILINRVLPGVSSVMSDAETGMRVLAERIRASRGEGTRVAYLGYTPVRFVSGLRRDALASACGALGLELRHGDVHTVDDIVDIDSALIGRILSAGCGALCCFNDVLALYTFQIMQLMDVRIPRDLSLTGFDDSPVRRLSPRRIDTVRLSAYDLGFEAAACLRRTVLDGPGEIVRTALVGDYVAGDTI